MRTNEIRLSDDEKNELDHFIVRKCGSHGMCYGAAVSLAVREALGGDE